jgi:hypothetical protein
MLIILYNLLRYFCTYIYINIYVNYLTDTLYYYLTASCILRYFVTLSASLTSLLRYFVRFAYFVTSLLCPLRLLRYFVTLSASLTSLLRYFVRFAYFVTSLPYYYPYFVTSAASLTSSALLTLF